MGKNIIVEKIVYKERSEHEFSHVTDTDKSKAGHAFFSDDHRKLGTLRIECDGGYFEPELWNIIAPTVEIENGVHKNLKVRLHKNWNRQPIPQ